MRDRFGWMVWLAVALALAPGHVLSEQKLRVVTTSSDLKSLAEAVGAGLVDVESLAASEQDPHAIELKPAQLARAQKASLLIRVGLDHEPWLTKLRLPQSASVLDTSRNVRLIQTQTPRLRVERRAHVHAFGNTHYWLDPTNAIAMAVAIRDTLAKLKPDHARAFEANTDAFVARLNRKMEHWSVALMRFRGAKIVVMHDSWSYFAERFGLSILAAAEPNPGVPPSPAELAMLLQRMRESGVKVLVTEPYSNSALVREITAKTGAHAITLVPSGTDYISVMDENVARLVAALKRDS